MFTFNIDHNDLIGEVTATLPTTTDQQNIATRNADSGIELDKFSTSPSSREAVLEGATAIEISTTDFNKKSKRSHKRSLSSDFFRDDKPKPVVTCVHRRNPCGRYCGHRRALSSDFRIDKIVSLEEIKALPEKPLRSVLFGHRRNPSNISQMSNGKLIFSFWMHDS